MPKRIPRDSFELPADRVRTAIDTFHPEKDKGLTDWLHSWKQLRAEGWDVHVVQAPDGKLIGMGEHGTLRLALSHQPPLHRAMLLQTLGATWTIDPTVADGCPSCYPCE